MNYAAVVKGSNPQTSADRQVALGAGPTLGSTPPQPSTTPADIVSPTTAQDNTTPATHQQNKDNTATAADTINNKKKLSKIERAVLHQNKRVTKNLKNHNKKKVKKKKKEPVQLQCFPQMALYSLEGSTNNLLTV